MNTFLIALFSGMFLGYAIADLLTVDSKTIYQIKRFKLKNSPGGAIDIEQGESANLSGKAKRDQSKIDRLAKRIEKKKKRSLRNLEK